MSVLQIIWCIVAISVLVALVFTLMGLGKNETKNKGISFHLLINTLAIFILLPFNEITLFDYIAAVLLGIGCGLHLALGIRK